MENLARVLAQVRSVKLKAAGPTVHLNSTGLPPVISIQLTQTMRAQSTGLGQQYFERYSLAPMTDNGVKSEVSQSGFTDDDDHGESVYTRLTDYETVSSGEEGYNMEDKDSREEELSSGNANQLSNLKDPQGLGELVHGMEKNNSSSQEGSSPKKTVDARFNSGLLCLLGGS